MVKWGSKSQEETEMARRGENIRKRKDGRWEGRYTAGYDANGKVITKNVLGKTQAEVKDKLRAAIEDSKKLDPVKAGSYTLEQWLKLWYSIYVEPQVRYSTREFYHNAIDHHIIPKLGSVKLEKLTMLQIQQFYNELLKSGRVQKKNQPELKEHGLSPRMVQCVHVVLNKALEHAVEEKLILANPVKKCKIPKNTHKEMNILPEALIGPYLSAAKEHGILAPMYLELTTGLRRGELLQRILDQSDDELLLLEIVFLEVCLQPLEEFFRKLDRHGSHIACHFCSFFHFVIICDKLFYEFTECPARSFLLLPHAHMERCVDLRAEVFLVCHWASSFPF